MKTIVLMRGLIGRFLARKQLAQKQKMVHRIHMHFLQKQMAKKIKTRLHYVRNCVIAAQKFVVWTARLRRLHFRQLTYVWDLYVKQMCENVAKRQDPTEDKKALKTEGIMVSQREIIARESKELGIQQRSSNSTSKLVNDKTTKSKFEVMLDFM